MSRIATLTAVLSMAVPIAASAGPAAADHPNYVERAAVVQTDLRSPDASTPVRFVSQQDLRSPDAATPVVAGHSAVAQTASDDGSLSSWAVIAIIAAAFAAIGLLVVLLRRHLEIERPLGV